VVVLTGTEEDARLVGKVPELALRLAKDLADGGCVLVLEEGDNVERDVPQAGRYGLLTYLDDCWQEPFERVLWVRETGARFFVARLAASRVPTVVVVADAEWLDERLRLVLDVEGEEGFSEG
jgi:hypothetical protein